MFFPEKTPKSNKFPKIAINKHYIMFPVKTKEKFQKIYPEH